MSVEAELSDGTILEFPDGTSPDVVRQTVKRQLGLAGPVKPAPAPDSSIDTGKSVMEGFVAKPQPPAPAAPVQSIMRRQPYTAPIDLGRPEIQNPDGSVSTERTITVGSDGRQLNIPTIVGGKQLTPDAAIAATRAGTNPIVGDYGSPAEAVDAAVKRSADIGQRKADIERVRSGKYLTQPTPSEMAYGALNRPVTPDEQPNALAIESFKAAPGIARASTGQMIADSTRAIPNIDGRIERLQLLRDDLNGRAVMGVPYVPPDYNNMEDSTDTQRALFTNGKSYQEELAQVDKQIADLKRKRDIAADVSESFQRDITDLTPKNQGMGGKVVTSVAGSIVPTFGALAVGAATGNPLLGASVMFAPTYANTYAQTMSTGDTARKIVPEFASLDNNVAREKYLDSILSDKYADTPFQTDAARVKETLGQINDKLQLGQISQSAARQMKERAFGSFARNMQTIATNANAGAAFWGGVVQGLAEVVGENLPLSIALKKGTPAFLKIFSTLAAEGGEEVATQIMQSLDQALRYDPTMTFKQGLEQVAIAGLSGAAMGGPMGLAGVAIDKSYQARDKRMAPKDLYDAVNGAQFNPDVTDAAVRASMDPSRAQMTAAPAPRTPARAAPGTPGDLAAVMADSRPLEAIRAEQAAQATQEAAPGIQAVANGAVEQSQVETQAQAIAANTAGIPARGDQTTVTWPDGETQTGTVRDQYADGATVEFPDGQIMDLTTADVKFGGAPLGEGTPAAPVVAETPEHVAQAAARVDAVATDAQKEAGNYRKGHIDFQGLNVTLENGKGSVRRSTDPNNRWETTMPAHYGYVKRSEGADGEQVDVYVGDNVASDRVYVIDQIDPKTGKFDEHKVMLGFTTKAHAVATYHTAFNDNSGPSRIGAITPMSMQEFKSDFLKGHDLTKPYWYKEARPAAPEKEQPLVAPKERAIDLLRRGMMKYVEKDWSLEQIGMQGGSLEGDAHYEIRGKKATVTLDGEKFSFGLEGLWPKWVKEAQASGRFESTADRHTRENAQALKDIPIGSWIFGGAIEDAADRPGETVYVSGAPLRVVEIRDGKFVAEVHEQGTGKEGRTVLVDPYMAHLVPTHLIPKASPPEGGPNGIRTVPEGQQQAPAVERPAESQSGQAVSAEGTAVERPVNEAGPPGAASQSEVRGEGDGGTTRPASNGGRRNEPVRGEGVSANSVGTILDTIKGENGMEAVISVGANDKVHVTLRDADAGESVGTTIYPSLGTARIGAAKMLGDAKPTKAKLIPTRGPGGSIEIRTEPVAPTFGETNKVFTKDAADKARELLRKKLGQVSMGLDPEIAQAGIQLAGYYIEGGARSFASYSAKMLADLGDMAKPYLKSWYAAVFYHPGMNTEGMEEPGSIKEGQPTAVAPETAAAVEPPAAVPAAAEPSITVTATTNTKTGEPIWVAKLPSKVSSDEYARTNAKAKRLGGYWSRFAKGFIFKSAEKANEFAGVVPAQEAPNAAATADNEIRPAQPDRTGAEPLAGAQPEQVPPAKGNEPVGAKPTGGGANDIAGNGGRPGGGIQPVRGMGEKPGTVPPATGGVQPPSRPATGQPSVQRPGGEKQGTPEPGVIVPQAGNFVITDELELGKGTPMQKYAGNVAAIKTLKALERENRDATPEEQQILARYVGWGGLKQAFPAPGAMPAKGWEGRVAEIRGLLTPEEYEAAARSIQDAHYTSKPVVDFMWNVARRLGFSGGKVLEDSMGVGNFFGLMPADLRKGASLTGVELDSITARIAKQLYPKARIMGPVGFHEVEFADNTFNLNIGNPPFGAQALYDPSAKHFKGWSIHNFFFGKAIDKMAPGGIHIQVVSRYLMDAETTTTREYLAHRTRLIGAIRLPWTAFYSNAGTEVVTDIIILQKLAENEWGTADESWVKTDTIPDPLGGDPMRVNQYYIDHPMMILGTMNRSGEMQFENDITVQPIEGSTLEQQFADVIEELPEGIFSRAKAPEQVKAEEDAAVAPEDVIEHYSVGQYFEDGGKLFQRNLTPDGSLEATEIHAGTQYSEKQKWGESRVARLRGMIGIRETERALLKAEASDAPAIELDMLRQQLNEKYDRYVAEHGFLNENVNEQVFRADPDSPLLLALENNFDRGVSAARAKTLGVKPRKPTADKMPIFTQRVVRPHKTPDKASSSADGLAISIQEKGSISIPYIASLTGKSESEVVDDLTKGDKPLAYFDPATESYETAAFYLSGNVKRKYQQARDAGLLDQAEHLKAVFPPDVKAGDINARMGAPWISRDVYERFVNHLLGEDAEASIQFVPATGGFAISSAGGDEVMVNVKWGAQYVTEDGATIRSRNAHDIIARILNNKDMVVWHTDSEGNRYSVKEETQAVQDKADEIRMEFEDWVFKDPAQREPLVNYYNENLNTTIEANWDGSYLTLPGKVPDAVIKLRRHQLNAIARWIRTGKILLDHVVGSGKTFTIVAALMEMRRLGIAKKPMIVVPNHLVEQWAISFYQLYPGAKILAMRKADFTKQNRQRMLARMATGDWDAVIFSHSSFGFVENDKEIVVAAVREQIAEMQAAINLARETEGKKSRTAAQYQKSKERMEQRLKELLDKPKDQLLTFQELGVDMLTVDESQEFKNLFFTTQRRGVGGFGNPNGSKRAMDMFIKAQWLQKTQQGRGVAFATGTPVSNSLTELFTLQRYLGLDDLKERGMMSLDAWLASFGVTATEYESNVTGTKYKRKERLRRITNAPEIMQLYKVFTDSVTNEDVKRNFREDNNGAEFPLPKVKGGKPRQNVVIPRSDIQAQIFADLQNRMDHLPPDPRDDNALAVLSDGRKAALDVRLIDPSLGDQPGSKVHVAADEITRIYKENTYRSGTQLVFLDLSTPNKYGKKDAEKYLKEAREILGDKNAAPFGDLRAQWKELRQRIQEKMDHMDEEKEAHGIDHIEKFLEQSAEIDAAVVTADSGFSVYDDLRNKLIDRGVAANEIAFIHDFNGDTKKQELFDMVNGGRIRVLLGSTAKMGAGTNVQRKLVALHHMDVPWRPSDIEQREGRIIRQGNEFRGDHISGNPDFEVEIFAYATEATSDVFFWQTQEQKLMGINSLRNFKGEREIEDVSADSMSAAEMKALASGNPLILEDVQLTESIRKLEAQRRRHISSEQDMESEVIRYQRYIDQLPPIIAEQQALSDKIDEYRNNPFPEGRPKADMDGQQMDATEARNHIRDVKQAADKLAYDANLAARERQDMIAAQSKTVKVGTEEFKALETEHAALEKAMVKPKFHVVFDGKEYNGVESAQKAVIEKLGDTEPIRIVIKGEDVIRRKDIEAKIDDIVRDWPSIESGRATLGTIGGIPIELEWVQDKHGKGVKITMGGESTTAEEKTGKGYNGEEWHRKADGSAILNNIIGLMRRVNDDLVYNKRRYEQAVKGIAPLKAQIGKPWGKDLELAQKKARVAEVRRILGGDDQAGPATQDDAKLRTAVADALTDEEQEAAGGIELAMKNYREWARHDKPTDIDEDALSRYEAIDKALREGHIEPKYSLGTGERPAVDAAAEVRRIAEEMFPKANLEMVDRLFGQGPAVVRSGAPSEARIEASGKYNTGRQLMTVAINYQDPTKTIRHEGVHALYDMGMFTPAEWTILQRESENRWMAQYGVPDNEEGIAKAFQFYRDGGKFAGPVGRAFDRVRDFLQRLGNALRGLGYQNVDDIFKRIESGEVGRAVRAGSMADLASMTLEGYAKMPLSYRMAVRDDLNAVLEKFSTGEYPKYQQPPSPEFLREQQSNKESAQWFAERKKAHEFWQGLRQRNGELAEKYSLGGDLPDNIAVIQKKSSQDIGPIARFFWNPRNAFARHQTLAGLQQYATDIETQIARTARNLTDEYNGIRSRFKGDDAGWSTLTDALWAGDADGVTFTEQQLREDLGWTDEKTIKAYQDFRTLVTKMGRLVDMHRRSMLPQYRARKAAVLERMRTLTAMEDKDFRALYGRRTRLRAKLRSGEGNEQALLATLSDIEKQMQGIREQTDEYQDLLAEVDRLDGILAETSIRKREGYVPHKFFGTYALYRLVQEPVLDQAGQPTMDEAGNPITETVHQLVAGEHGFYPSQREAIAAAKRASALTPEDAFVVRPVQFKFPNSAATTLTDASYWMLMSKASKAMGLSGQDLKDAMEGVARRRFRRRIAGFTQMRTGVEGFSDDMDKVMRAHVNEVVRYVFLDKLKYRAINDMERMGMSPFRSANQQFPTLTRMVEAYLRDINGQKQPGEIAADEALDKILATPWGKPALVGIPAAAAGASLMFGIATNPIVAAAVSSYVGLRLYSSLSKAGEFKSRAITQDLMSDMAHAKLGAIFNMGSAMVNLTQTAINTMPVLGPKYTLMGMIKLEEALRSKIMGKPNEDYRLLERSDTISNDTYTETQLLAVAQHSLARWSLFFFRTTENFNRAVAFLGGIHRAKDRGALPGPAFKEAESVMGFTQHHYGPSNKAEVLRNVFLRVPGQFKNYMMQQIAFTFELGRKGATGRSIYDEHMQLDRDAILWHLGSLFLVSGAIGLPFVALLNVLIRSIFDYDPLDELKKKALEMQAASKLSAGAWLTMVRGLPAWALGEDVSQRAGMGEQFTPQQLSDLAGPWWSTMDKARQLGELQAGFVDQLANLSPGAGKPLKAIEAMANGMPLWTAATDNKAFFQALADDKINWVSPWKNKTEFDESILSKADVARMAVGSTPTKVAMARSEVQGIAQDVALDKKVTQLYVNRIISAVRTYGHNEAKLDAALNKIQADMEKANVNVSEKSIKKALADAQTPRLQRAIKGAPSKMRGEAAQRATPLMEQGQTQP